MATLCGLCNSEPSKYKCPKCQLPYCSLACYKPHKTEHLEDPEPPKAFVLDEEAEEIQGPAPQGYKSWPPDFYALPTNPEFQALMKRYPNLKLELGSILLKTMEPPPEENQQSYRGFGRGRGRGGRGRGRGRGGPVRWTRDKGEKDALRLLQQLGDDDKADTDGVREFVDLVARLYEKEKAELSR